MDANDVRKALRNRFSDHRRYAIAEEVGLTTAGCPKTAAMGHSKKQNYRQQDYVD